MEHYPRAPIAEAILDIQVRASTVPSQDSFEQLAKSLFAEFPQSADLNLNQFQVNVSAAPAQAPPTIAHTHKVSGVRLSSSERVLFVQPRGMTFNHLPPYTSWEVFQPKARELWERYVQFIKPEAVTRVALRYINRIEIPEIKFETSDYFHLYPEIPKNITQDMSAFFMQIQMPQVDLGPDVTAAINFTPVAPSREQSTSFVLDIDVFALRDLPILSDAVFNVLNVIRTRKNDLFEACITEKTRKLFR
jgi:uncharacterized protein (TIGR04255 family)